MTYRNTLAHLVTCGLVMGFQTTAKAEEPTALADRAVERNPGLTAVKSRIAALEQRVRGAGAWLDPRVAVEYSNIPIDKGVPGDHAMSGLQLKLQQTFLFPGKTGLRREVARGAVREQRIQLEERKIQLRAMVKRAYYSLALVRQLKKVTQGHIKLVDQFIDVVRVKYEVGKVGQHDLLRLTVLRDKLKDDIEEFDRDDLSLTAAINAALHRGVDQPIRTPDRIKVSAPGQTTAQLVAEAELSRPQLRLYLERARTHRVAARRAAREGYPDITAWIGYRVRIESGADEGTDFFSVGASVPIPFSNSSRWGSQRREHLARAKAVVHQRAAELDVIRGDLGRQVAVWRRAVQQAAVYRTRLMPRAHRTLDATFSAYQVDRADFASLFQAELQLLDFERTIMRAEARAALARVKIEALTGKRPH